MAPIAWRRAWPWLRVAAGVAVIAAIVRVVGAGAFIAGLRAIDVHAVLAALAITVLTTFCCAWRWQLVVRGFGGELRIGRAIAAYYRSQFLDSTLPGGILGDVYRAVRRGVHVSDLGRGARGVFWERVLGQLAQLASAALVLLVLPSPVRPAMPFVLAAAVAAVVVLVGVHRFAPPRMVARWRDAVAGKLGSLRGLSPAAWVGIVVASALALAGYALIFAIAARAVGVTLSAPHLAPLLLLALVASAIPFNVAGFGPREGAAAWVFGAAGAGAHAGVAAATLYGVLSLVAVAPGVLLLVVDALDRDQRAARPRR